jgi:hypothetical protein
MLAAMSCQTSRQLELAARAPGNEANPRHEVAIPTKTDA